MPIKHRRKKSSEFNGMATLTDRAENYNDVHNVYKTQKKRVKNSKLQLESHFTGKMIDPGWFSNTEEIFTLTINTRSGEMKLDGGIDSKIGKMRDFTI